MVNGTALKGHGMKIFSTPCAIYGIHFSGARRNQVDPVILTEIVSSLGLPIALTVFLLWWMHSKDKTSEKREERREKRIEELENGRGKKLVDLTESSIESNVKTAVALEKNSEALNRFSSVMGDLGCVQRRKDGE
jgi:hypothetical protein